MTSTILFVCAGIFFVVATYLTVICISTWDDPCGVLGNFLYILSVILLYVGLSSYRKENQSKYIYFVRLDVGEEYSLDPQKNKLKFNGDWISFVDDYGKHISAKGFTATARLKDEVAIPCIRAGDLSRIPTETLIGWKKLLRNEFTESKSDNYYEILESYVKVNDELSKRELRERLPAVKKEAEQ